MDTKLNRFFAWLGERHAQEVDDPSLLREIFMDDASFAGDVLQTALQTVEQYRRVLTDQTLSSTDRSFYLAVHSLKSTLQSIGMNGLGAYLQTVEAKVKRGETLSEKQRSDLQQQAEKAWNVINEMHNRLTSSV